MNSAAAGFLRTALILCLAVIVATAGIMMLPIENSRTKMKFLKCQCILPPLSGYYTHTHIHVYIYIFYIILIFINICIYKFLLNANLVQSRDHKVYLIWKHTPHAIFLLLYGKINIFTNQYTYQQWRGKWEMLGFLGVDCHSFPHAHDRVCFVFFFQLHRLWFAISQDSFPIYGR